MSLKLYAVRAPEGYDGVRILANPPLSLLQRLAGQRPRILLARSANSWGPVEPYVEIVHGGISHSGACGHVVRTYAYAVDKWRRLGYIDDFMPREEFEEAIALLQPGDVLEYEP